MLYKEMYYKWVICSVNILILDLICVIQEARFRNGEYRASFWIPNISICNMAGRGIGTVLNMDELMLWALYILTPAIKTLPVVLYGCETWFLTLRK